MLKVNIVHLCYRKGTEEVLHLVGHVMIFLEILFFVFSGKNKECYDVV